MSNENETENGSPLLGGRPSFGQLLRTVPFTSMYAELEADESPLDPDEAFTAFAIKRRRLIVRAFVAHEKDVLTTWEIANYVASGMEGKPAAEIADKVRKKEYTATYQRHANILDEREILDWDPDAGEATRGAAFDDAVAVLDAVDQILGDERGADPDTASAEVAGR